MFQKFLTVCALGVTCFALAGTAAVAQKGSHDGHAHKPAAPLKQVDAAAIAKPGELEEVIVGDPAAPITIIEYASITCGHCGRFHRDLLPEIKTKYIDTGIARLFVREFPLEGIAAAAAMMARCAGHDKTYDVVDMLFQRQQQWLRNKDMRDAFVAIAKEFDMDEATFDACLKDDGLLKRVAGVRKRATEDFGVRSTPTFFINGKPLVGPKSLAEFDAVIQPLLKSTPKARP